MFTKTIEALKAAEAAIEEELKALWVPYDPNTGGGGVHWHAAGAGLLSNAGQGISNLRADLEVRQAAQDEANAKAEAAAAPAAPTETSAEPAEPATTTLTDEPAATEVAPGA